MTATRRPTRALEVVLLWLVTGGIISAPLWLAMGVPGVALGWMGPPGILAFKPGDGMLAKLALAAVGASPVVAGGVLAARRWAGLGRRGRALWVVGLSAVWHLPAAAMRGLIMAGLN